MRNLKWREDVIENTQVLCWEDGIIVPLIGDPSLRIYYPKRPNSSNRYQLSLLVWWTCPTELRKFLDGYFIKIQFRVLFTPLKSHT